MSLTSASPQVSERATAAGTTRAVTTLTAPEGETASPALQPVQPSVTVVGGITQPTNPSIIQKAWNIALTCGRSVYAQIENLPDGTLDLSLSDGGPIQWNWSNESLASQFHWLEIQPQQQEHLYDTLAFWGRDSHQKWWIGVVSNLCQSADLSAILPVNDPQGAVLEIYPNSDGLPEVFWLMDDGRLNAYRWVDGQAFLAFTLDEIPNADFSIWAEGNFTDLIGDSKPEVFIRWGDPLRPYLYQILTEEGGGYRLIGEIEPGWQFVDVDADGAGEFLRPQPEGSPSRWEVYKWKRDQFEWVEPLQRPTAPSPTFPEEFSLPRLPADMYYWRDGDWWLWQNTGGSPKKLSQPPPQAGEACHRENIPEWQIVSWSPDCRYAVLSVPGTVEGSSNALLDTQTSREISTPNSFTYTRGLSTFAWDPGSRYLIHTRADGGEGLYRILLPGGAVEPVMSMNMPIEPAPESYFWGAVDPVVLPGGSIGFVVEGTQNQLYPPPGVYKLDPDGQLHMLAEIPTLPYDPQDPTRAFPGRVIWSPDGSAFLYSAPSPDGQRQHYQVLLLGKTNGSAVWDITRIFNDAQDFRWRGMP